MAKLKIALIIAFVCLFGYFISLYYKVMSFLNTYSYSYEIKKVSSNILNGLSALKSGVNASFDFVINIKNPSDFRVTVSDLNIKFYYKNNYLGYSDKFNSIYIPKQGSTSFNGSATISLNQNLLNSILALGSGYTLIEYTAKFKLYGLPFNFTYKGEKQINLSDYV